MKHPKLRDSNKLRTHEPYPMNEFPDELIMNIGQHLIYLLCIGRKDIGGSDWGEDSLGNLTAHNSPSTRKYLGTLSDLPSNNHQLCTKRKC